MYRQPYYICPFVAQGMNQAGMPQQMMSPVQPSAQQFMSPAYPGIPLMPFSQAPGIHLPSSMAGFQDMYPSQGMDFTLGQDADIPTSPMSSADPPPVLSDNPATVNIVLFKELTGYPNYGNPSGNADILYTGNRGVWNFQLPAFLFVPGNLRAQIVLQGVLDDHYDVPVERYSARITINGTVVHTGRLPLVHGRPSGQRFENWRPLTFNVPHPRRSNRVVIENTSNAGPNDWIAFDWMELRLSPRS
jgi:hypothetical protein